jgi:hypothetical protein
LLQSCNNAQIYDNCPFQSLLLHSSAQIRQ